MDPHIMITFLGIIMSTGIIFMYCLLGTLTTTVFLRYAESAYNSLWYRYPNELQKYSLQIIANSQHLLRFNALGIFDLDLVLFTKVNWV